MRIPTFCHVTIVQSFLLRKPELPPIADLLRPPRRSIDPLEWSRAHGDRPCLSGLQSSRRAKAIPRRALSPLKSERRNSAYHVPACVMPKERAFNEDIHNQPSAAPIPLTTRCLRELSYAKAEQMRRERLGPRAAAPIDGARANVRIRRHSVDLPPIQLPAPPAATLQQRPYSADSTHPSSPMPGRPKRAADF